MSQAQHRALSEAVEDRLRADYLVFLRAGTEFAVPTHIAREVLDARPFTVVPQAPQDLIGAFNLRGEVVPLLNLDRLLGVPSRAFERTDTLLVIGNNQLVFAALVDQVTIVRHIPPWQIKRLEAGARGRQVLIRGTVGSDDQKTVVLDSDRLLGAVVAEITAGFRRGEQGGTHTGVPHPQAPLTEGV